MNVGPPGFGGGVPPAPDPPDPDPPDPEPDPMPGGPGGGPPHGGNPFPRQGDERGENDDPERDTGGGGGNDGGNGGGNDDNRVFPGGPGGGPPHGGAPFPKQGGEDGPGGDPARGEPDPDIDPNNPGSAPPDPDLEGVGTSTYTVGKNGKATLVSNVQNTGAEAAEMTVSWSVGGQQVGSETRTVDARSTQRFDTKVSAADLRSMGYVGDSEGRIKAELSGGSDWNSQTAEGGKIAAKKPPKDDKNDDGDDSDSGSWAIVPPFGGLTSKQATAASALGLVVLLGVLP